MRSVVVWLLLALAGCSSQQEDGVAPHAHGRFHNAYPFEKPDLDNIVRWQWQAWQDKVAGRRLPDRPQRIPRQRPELAALAANREHTGYTWLGHASGLLQQGGLNVLIDPIFSERVSPVQWSGPRRLLPSPASLAELPRIDVVLVSHNHFDHLDRGSVRQLLAQSGGQPVFVVPLGVDRWLRARGAQRVVALDWWHSTRVGAVEFTATPAQHWSKRGVFDANRTLWAGWAIKGGGHQVWFAGDTGYVQPLFVDIGRRLGRIDLALLPVGAYQPRWFMQAQHVDPEQAVRIFRDTGARLAVGVHWGLFRLADEAVDAPLDDLPAARTLHGVGADAFRLLPLGGTLWLSRS